MKRYEEYKPMKYEWLPEIPAHWETRTMRSFTTVSSERRGDREATLLSVYREYGVVIKASRDDNRNVESEDLSNYKWVRPGDLVMNKMKMWQGSLGVSEHEGIVSPAYIVCRINDATLNRRYLHTLLRSTGFKTYYNQYSYGVRVGQWDMHYEDFKGLEIALPPRAEQDQIVRYLDWQVSKINRLIAAKKQEIALFEESKINHITNAVLHGVRHHEHCIETTEFGSIPAHWQVIQNKRLFCERVEHTETGAETLLSVSKHYGVKPSAALTEDEQFATIKPALSLVGYKVVRKNDLVMNIMRARNGSYGISDYDGIVSPAYCIYYTTKECNVKYLHYFLRTPHVKSLFEAYSSGIAEHRRRLYPEDFLRLKSVLPPIEEQDEIVEHIEQAIVKYDAGIANLRQQIACLQDMKTRLISDVVTGQVDVRGIEVPEYVFVEDSADEENDDLDEMEEE